MPAETFEDISWAAIIKGAKNGDNGRKFIEFMLSESAQNSIMMDNGEVPANKNVTILPTDDLALLYNYTPMVINYEQFGSFAPQAIRLIDMAGWQ
jgi:ABC-type Fe3+ transport system substrate-binding protein